MREKKLHHIQVMRCRCHHQGSKGISAPGQVVHIGSMGQQELGCLDPGLRCGKTVQACLGTADAVEGVPWKMHPMFCQEPQSRQRARPARNQSDALSQSFLIRGYPGDKQGKIGRFIRPLFFIAKAGACAQELMVKRARKTSLVGSFPEVGRYRQMTILDGVVKSVEPTGTVGPS